MRKYLIIAIVLVLLIGGSLTYYAFGIFHLISVVPARSSAPSTYTTIVFHFNKPMAASTSTQNTLVISPSVEGRATVSGRDIIFTPSFPLASGQKYSVTLGSVADKMGEAAPNVTLSFIPKNTEFTSMTIFEQQNYQRFVTADTKFIESLPYITGNYQIEYVGYNNSLEVTVLSAPVNQNEAAALDYIRSKGVDTSLLPVTYSLPAVLSGHPGP